MKGRGTLSNFTELIERARSVDTDLARDLEIETLTANASSGSFSSATYQSQ